MSQHQTGSFIYKSLVLWIQNSFFHIFVWIRAHNLLGRSRLRSSLSSNKSKTSVHIVLTQPATILQNTGNLTRKYSSIEWLGDIVISTKSEPFYHKVTTSLSCQQDNRQPWCFLVFLDAATELISVHSRHHDIWNNDITHTAFFQIFQGSLCTFHINYLIRITKSHSDIFAKIFIVIDKKKCILWNTSILQNRRRHCLASFLMLVFN